MSFDMLLNAWRNLTEPPSFILDEWERRQARLLSTFLVFIIPLMLALTTWVAIEPGVEIGQYDRNLLVFLLLVMGMVVLSYWLSRTKFHIAASYLLLSLCFVLTVSWAVMFPGQINSITPVFGILVATAIFTEVQVTLILLANCAAIFILPQTIPELGWDIPTLIRFNIIFGVTGILVAARRRWDWNQIAQQSRDLSLEFTRRLEAEVSIRHYLEKVADQVPGAIYEFQMTADGTISFPFISKGIAKIHPGMTAEMLMNDAGLAFSTIHPDDLDGLRASIQASYTNLTDWDVEFRIILGDGSTKWHRGNAKPEKREDGSVIWYGYFQDITERKHARERIETQVRRLESLHIVDMAIANSLDIRLTLRSVVEAARTQLGVDAVAVLLYKPSSNTLEFTVGIGLRSKRMERGQLQMGKGIAGRAAIERRMLHIPDLRLIKDDYIRVPLFMEEGFITYYAAPLIAKGELKGVLEILHREHLSPEEDWVNFLESLAGQAAVAIDSAQSFEELQRSNIRLMAAYDSTIEGWSRAMDLRDKETEGHTQRVTNLTIRLAQAIEMSEEEIVHIRRGALLHDMGKLGVPDHVLFKPGKLSDEEWGLMRQHPQYAYDMLSSIEYLRPALDIPYCHHEKWDGTGYPRGLKGDQIPLPARLFAVVDVWDALTSDRPYRAAWTKEQVLEHVKAGSGSHFDPQVVKLFLELISKEKEDILSTG